MRAELAALDGPVPFQCRLYIILAVFSLVLESVHVLEGWKWREYNLVRDRDRWDLGWWDILELWTNSETKQRSGQ